MSEYRWLAGCIGLVWVHADSLLHSVASPFHTCVTTIGVQLLSLTVQRGNAEMYHRSGLVISREQGLRYDAGLAVPVLMS